MKIGSIVRRIRGVFFFVSLLVISKKEIRSKTLLLIRLDRIGDYVLFRNFIEVLKKSEKYKGYKITLIGNVVWRELSEIFDKEFVDDFIWVDTKKLRENVSYRRNILKDISNRGFEVAIHPTFSRELFMDAIVKASNAEERIGSQGDCSNIKPWQKRLSDRWYSHLIPTSAEPITELQRNADFIKGLGITSPHGRIPYIEITQSKTHVVNEDDYYIVAPGALWGYRRWPLEHFAEIAGRIYDATGLLGLVCGSAEERNLGEKLKDLSDAWLENIAGKTTLSELAKVIKGSRFVVGNETGVIHIASAAGTFAICILGGGHYGRFVPYQAESTPTAPLHVEYKMDCFGCNWLCKYECGVNAPYPCIRNISVDSVWSKVQMLVCPKHNNTVTHNDENSSI